MKEQLKAKLEETSGNESSREYTITKNKALEAHLKGGVTLSSPQRLVKTLKE